MKKKDITWRVYNREELYSDEEFVRLIQEGKVQADDLITNKDLRVWLPLKETIYAFYLPTGD